MVELPEQLRKQSEAIKAHFENPTPPAANGTPSAEPAPAAPAPAGEPPANSAASAPGPTGGQPEDPNSETYQQRYRTLQGIHNAEITRSNQRIQQLEQLLAALPAAPPQPAAQPASSQAQPVAFVTEKDREEYGESIRVMRDAAREEVHPLINRITQLETTIDNIVSSLNQQLVPQVQQVAQRQAESAHDRFWSQLDGTVPYWRQMNADPAFQSWLLEIDPLTGVTRQAHLEQAQNSLQATRVAAFFTTFSDLTGKYKPNASAQPNRSAQTSELEAQVSPGRSRGTAAPTGQVPITYTRADIAKFFDDVRSGKYKGREVERNRIERDIFSAQAERRITG